MKDPIGFLIAVAPFAVFIAFLIIGLVHESWLP